jgi:hypothetical protein
MSKGSVTLSLRSVSGAIRQDTPEEVGSGHFAESLLILGLEGSRDECYTLWVFKNGFRPLVLVEEAQEVDGLELDRCCGRAAVAG